MDVEYLDSFASSRGARSYIVDAGKRGLCDRRSSSSCVWN